MVRIPREADANPIAEVAKKHGIREQTIYVWRKKFGSMDKQDVCRLKDLEKENVRRKRLLEERDLEIDFIKDVVEEKITMSETTRASSSVALAR